MGRKGRPPAVTKSLNKERFAYCALLFLALTFQKQVLAEENKESQLTLPGLGSHLQPIAQKSKTDEGYTVSGKPVSKQQYEAVKLHDEGLLLMRSNSNEQAMQKFKQSIAAFDGYAEVHHSLALSYAKLGNTDEAINELKRAVELNPDLPSSWIALGGVYQAKGDIDQAIETYDAFLKRFPQDAMLAKISGLRRALENQKNQQLGLLKEDIKLGVINHTQASNGERDDYLALMENSGSTRWPRNCFPISVYLSEGQSVPGYHESLRVILKRSFEDWAKASSGRVSFVFVASESNAKMKCFWTNRLSDLKSNDSKAGKESAEAGEAKLTMDQDGISNAEIWFLTQTLGKSMPLTDNVFRQIALHEIGHALGLSGHTNNPDDIMFYSTTFNESWRELSGRDSRSITRLYREEP